MRSPNVRFGPTSISRTRIPRPKFRSWGSARHDQRSGARAPVSGAGVLRPVARTPSFRSRARVRGAPAATLVEHLKYTLLSDRAAHGRFPGQNGRPSRCFRMFTNNHQPTFEDNVVKISASKSFSTLVAHSAYPFVDTQNSGLREEYRDD